MNIAKDFCDCIVSWEVQENRKISTVVHCSYSQTKTDKIKNSEEMEMDFAPVLLTPFLHPELTKATYCDLKIFVSPKLAVKFDRFVIISTAKMTEFYDRNSELTFSTKGEKITKVERGKEDGGDKVMSYGFSKTPGQKTSSRWFIHEYIPSIDTFEVMVRFCDHFVPNQLYIKYIGVKVVTHDWSAELGSFNLAAPVLGTNTGGHIGSTGSICSNTITVNCDKIMDAIQNVNNAVQVLANEVGCAHKGSNPHLPTISSLDTTLYKHRRPNSPMTSGTGSPSANYWTGISTRRSSDITNLQLWLETRLTSIEIAMMKGLEQLSNRISQLEVHLNLPSDKINVLNSNGNPTESVPSYDKKDESNSKPNESANEKISSCHKS